MQIRKHIWTLRLACTLLIVCGCWMQLSAQSEPDDKRPDSTARGTIKGRVVNESGEPLANAALDLRGYGGAEVRRVNADAEGNFEFNDLPPLAYLISAYLPSFYSRPRDPDLNPIGYYRVGDSVRLEMTKGGVITGAVKRANGEPIISINVNAYMIRDYKGQPSRYSTATRTGTTDDRGIYRLYGLTPGTYVISAGSRSQGYQLDAFVGDVPTYAPSSTRDTAAEFTVIAGEETANVDIRYRDEPGHVVSGSASGLPANEPQRYQIELISILNGLQQASSQTYQLPGQGFMISGVADGDYNIMSRSYSPAGVWYVSDLQRIKVRGADISGIGLNLRPLGSINGTVVLEDSKAAECQGKRRPLLGEIVIAAWHNEKSETNQPAFIWGLGGPMTVDEKGSFGLRNLAAGQYRFVTRPLAKYWYLKSISWPASVPKPAQSNQPLDAARNWTTLKSGDRLSGLTITFSAGAASIQGKVEPGPGQKLSARMFVYLAPAETEKREDIVRYFVSLADDDGAFVLSNVPPGRYWIIAQSATESDSNMLSKLRTPDETELRARILRDAEANKNQTEIKPCQNVTDYRLVLGTR